MFAFAEIMAEVLLIEKYDSGLREIAVLNYAFRILHCS